MGLPAIFYIFMDNFISPAGSTCFHLPHACGCWGAWGLVWGEQGEGAGGCSVLGCCADTGVPPSMG